MKMITYAVAVMLIALLSGCSAATKTIMSKSQGERTDIFKEVPASDSAAPGYCNVIIKATIKTHAEDHYIGESKESVHGKQSYPILVNIDGQAALWNVPGVRDSKPAYEQDGRTSREPEAGEGMKYILEKKIRLSAGSHRVFFALPRDNYFLEADIPFQNGEMTIIEFKPVYRYKTTPTRIPTFLKGISHYEIYLNGNRS